MLIGRSSAQRAFQPAEANRGYQALSVEILRSIRIDEHSALHLTHRGGRADSGETTKNGPSRRACWNTRVLTTGISDTFLRRANERHKRC
jgi:hypothetical protein